MLKPYVVKQGDYLAKIAVRFGFDADKVWNDPKNDALRKMARTPNILHPGDILHIPEPEGDYSELKTGAENQFQADVPRVRLTLVFADAEGSALANAVVKYHGLPPSNTNNQPEKTDGAGKLVVVVSLTTTAFIVELPEKGVMREVLVGHMDPVSERSGQLKRLQHLGYGMSPLLALAERMGLVNLDEEEEHLRVQLMAFQLDNGLEPSGAATKETCDKLVAKHGS